MTDHDNSQGEPTMEEILASIRRIISEDNEESESSASKAEARDTPKGPPHEAPRDAEVLELSPAQRVQEDSTSSDDSKPNGFDRAATGYAAEPLSEPGREDAPKMGESTRPAGSVDKAPATGPANEVEETLLSPEVATAAAAAFGALSKDVTVSRSGEIRSLEELVKEMMKPMLKDWLDENLPPLVEDVVEREVRRLSYRRVRR